MLNILSLKKNKEAQQNGSKKPKTTAAQIRLQKDLGDMENLPSVTKVNDRYA
jgi:ubiquitin-conjugating enzyme E2 M